MAGPAQIAPWLGPAALADLLGALRGARFRIDVRHYQRVQDLALAVVDGRVELDDPRRLETLIAPIVCQSAGDQRRFAELFDDWLERLGTGARPVPIGRRGGNALFTTLDGLEAQSRQWLWSLVVGLIVLTGLAWLASDAPVERPQVEQSAPVDTPASSSPAPLPPSSPSADRPADVTPPSAVSPAPAAPPIDTALRWWLWAGAVVSLIVAAVGLWIAAWLLRGHRFLTRETTTRRPALETLRVATAAAGVHDRRTLVRLAAACRIRVSEQGNELAIPETLERTINAGGLFSPVLGRRRRLPEYLALIGRDAGGDQQAALVEHLLTALSKGGVWITRYYFDRDPRLCVPERGGEGPLSLRELAGRFPDHRLLIFADTSAFADPVTGELAGWLPECEVWRDRAIMAPGIERRSALEEELAGRTPVLPATLEGLSCLLAGLHTDRRPRPPHEGGAAAPMPEVIAADPDAWLARAEPEPADVERLLRSLQTGLDPEAHALVSACAVYPVMHWNLTLAMGAALEKHLHLPILTTHRLATIAQLPWFRRGYMPTWLRRHLVDAIPRPQGLAIRRTIDALLLSSLTGASGDTALQIAQDRSPAMSRLAASVRRLLERGADAPEELHDHVFRRFMVGRRTRTLAVRIPPALRAAFAARSSRRPPAGSGFIDAVAMASWVSRPLLIRACAAVLYALPMAGMTGAVAAGWPAGDTTGEDLFQLLLIGASPLVGFISSSRYIRLHALQSTTISLAFGVIGVGLLVLSSIASEWTLVLLMAILACLLLVHLASMVRAFLGSTISIPIVTGIAARAIFGRNVDLDVLLSATVDLDVPRSDVDTTPFWLICLKALFGLPSAYAAVVDDNVRLLQTSGVVALSGALAGGLAAYAGLEPDPIRAIGTAPLLLWAGGSLLSWMLAFVILRLRRRTDSDDATEERSPLLRLGAWELTDREEKREETITPMTFAAPLGLSFMTLNVALAIGWVAALNMATDRVEFVLLVAPIVALGLLWMAVVQAVVAVHAAIEPYSWARALAIVLCWLLIVVGGPVVWISLTGG